MFVLVLNVLFRVTFKSSYKTSDNSLFIILSWGEKKTKKHSSDFRHSVSSVETLESSISKITREVSGRTTMGYTSSNKCLNN